MRLRAGTVRLVVALALSTCACSPRRADATHSQASARPPESGSEAAAAAGDATPDAPALALTSAVLDASAPADPNAGAASADAAAAKTYARVLHVGDSTVGGNGGLTKALRTRFEAGGSKFTSDTTVSLAITTFARSPNFRKLLAKTDPDLVLITLGTNDVFVPAPQSLAWAVQMIAEKSQTGRARECVWIGPPLWKGDTGITEVIRANAAPCRFFDSGHMNVPRAGDGIHPTDKGGEAWAALFWTFFQSTDTTNAIDLDASAPGVPH